MAAKRRNNDGDKKALQTFLEEFSKMDDKTGVKIFPYRTMLTKIAHREEVSLVINMDDLIEFDEEIAKTAKENATRYVSLFLEVVQEILPNFKERHVLPKDTLDIYIDHLLTLEQRNQTQGEQRNPQRNYPPELIRRFEVFFKDSSNVQPSSVREIGASHIGKLVTLRGIVTKATEVKPMIAVATYTCDRCGAENYQTIQSMVFMPMRDCTTPECTMNKNVGRLQIQTKGSKFVKFQEIKIQEHSDQVPTGHVPRSLSIYCRGEVTRNCNPGDHVNVTGIYLPLAKSGFVQKSAAGLLCNTFVDAHSIVCMSNALTRSDTEEMTPEELQQLTECEDLYSKLANSIAPEIFGMEDVKKALLLLLVGGTDKTTADLKIRGSINICLMGDPGVAKSQLLSFITRLAPRSQYTTGRGSSGVGLTAAVVKDPLTNQMMLEGGALVLADQGVCCIDEFDKMAEADRTAIHEVMEQQTISIAKAGIMTRLNARVAILAAANPCYGRYNLKRSIEQNIQLPAALLSRFDLLWLLLDRADDKKDRDLAKHITYVHQHSAQPPNPDNVDFFDMELMRRFIKVCKTKNPAMTEDITEYIVDSYVEMREESRNSADKTFTSPRNLLAVMRLSTALARLRLSETVIKDDVTEALRLVAMSKHSINVQGNESEQRKPNNVKTANKWFLLIKQLLGDDKSIDKEKVYSYSVKKGYTRRQVEEFIDEYSNLNTWYVESKRLVLV